VSSSSGFVVGQLYLIGTEIVQVQTIPNGTSVTVLRGLGNTATTNLPNGAPVTLAYDQRGLTRTVGTVDVGAVEVQAPPSLPTAPLARGQVGQPYGQTISASNGTGLSTLTYTTGGPLPAGITITGGGAGGALLIAGTPTQTGSVTVTVTATDEAGVSSSATYVLNIDAQLTLVAPVPVVSNVLKPFNQAFLITGGTGTVTVTFTVSGTLPAGLTLNRAATGGPLNITGTPTGTGAAVITATATDSAGVTTTASFSLTVNQSPSVSAAIAPNGVPTVVTVNSAGKMFINGTFVSDGVRSASVSFGPNGQVLLVVYQSGALVRFDGSGASLIVGGDANSATLAFAPNGSEVLLVTTQSGALYRRDSNGISLLAISGVYSVSLAFAPNGKEVLVAVDSMGAIYRAESSGITLLAPGGAFSVDVSFTPAGVQVLTAVLLDGSLVSIGPGGFQKLGALS
jgi:hypothetical protein